MAWWERGYSHVAVLVSGGWTTLATCRPLIGAYSIRDPCGSSICYLLYLVRKVLKEGSARGGTRLSGDVIAYQLLSLRAPLHILQAAR